MNQDNILNHGYVLPLCVLFIFIIALTGCSDLDENEFSKQQWRYDHLRAIDPADGGIPYLDIVAVYIADNERYLGVRLDLLDIGLNDLQQILLTIDFEPGGSAVLPIDSSVSINLPNNNHWDIAIELLSEGEIRGFDSSGEVLTDLRVSMYKDTFLDAVVINISKIDLLTEGSPFLMNLYTIEPSSGVLVDSVTSISSISLPPSPAPVLLGFWNTLQAYTPAQVLRMWDGAHSGPMSSRHGFRHLLEAVEVSGLPVVLFSDDMAGLGVVLEFLGVYDYVVGMVDFCCLYCGAGVYLGDFWGFGYTKNNLNVEFNLAEDTLKKIVDAALTGEPVLLGGDLSQSLWGTPQASGMLFRYIKEHPWIKPITITDYLTIYHEKQIACSRDSIPHLRIDLINPVILNEFQKLYDSTPDNTLKELASQTYKTIMTPINLMNGLMLESYFGQLGHILYAAEWMDNPDPISSCDVDLDWDGENECVLASDSTFITIEPKGGYLVFAFYLEADSIHQLIAPMYEVVAGLGDPITNEPEKGAFADAALIPGAMAIRDHYNDKFKIIRSADRIELFNEGLGIRKSISLSEEGMQLSWISEQPYRLQVPFILDPWMRFNPEWSSEYFKQLNNGIQIWGLKNKIEIIIETNADNQFDTFLDSKTFFNQPENPNFEYPDGHYLPFPTAVLGLSPTENAFVDIEINIP